MFKRVINDNKLCRYFAMNSSVRLAKNTSNLKTSDNKESIATEVKPFKEVPKIPSLPFIGTAWTLLPVIGKYEFRKFHKASELKFKEYGNIIREDMTKHHSFVHVFDPVDFEKVFRNEGKYPVRQPVHSLVKAIEQRKDIFNNVGLINSAGEEWYSLRSKVQGHMLKPKTTINFLKAMDEVAKDFVKRMHLLKDPNTMEINDYSGELNRFSLESICLVGLDTRLGCFDMNLAQDSETMKLIKAAVDIFDMMYKLEFMAPFWRIWPTPLFRKFCATHNFFTEVAQKHLHQARIRLEKNNDKDRELSLLELLLTEDMDPRNVNVMINDMFLAGIDTTSNSSAFFFYHMAKNPKDQEKVYQDIKRLLPDKNSPITEEVLQESRYLKACVKESMRLLPVVIGTARILANDTVLAGYNIPAGTQVLVHVGTASKNESNFKDALSYKPERWLRDNPDHKMINPYTFLPFGFGPRACIGRRIVEQEMYTLFIRVLQKFRLEYHFEDMDLYTGAINKPDKPLRYEFHDRL